MENDKRYFWVFFTGITEDGSFREGRYEISTTGGWYINELGAKNMISKNFQLDEVYIKDVRELTESDYKDFTSGRPLPPDPNAPPKPNFESFM